MPLFIDWLPLHVTRDPLMGAGWLGVALPILVTDPGLSQPAICARVQRWLVDTRFTGEAFAWRHHLEEAGLNVMVHRPGQVTLTPHLGVPRRYPLRTAQLWLASNLAGLHPTPWRLRL
jgi:hypothetical protein